MTKLKKILLALATSVALTMTMNAYAEDSFVPCKRFGRMQNCIAVPLADQTEDAEAKRFLPPAGDKARLYIVRPYTQEQREKSSVLLDGRQVAELAPLTYVTLDVTPGTHQIALNTRGYTEIQLDVAPGKVYYIQYQLNILFNTVTGVAKILDEKEGQSSLLLSKKVRPAGK